MPPRSYQIKPPTNPILQVLYFVAGGVILIGAIVMGAVLLAVALGIAIVVGLVIFARVWWLKRKFRAAARQSEAIEVEYTVIDERDERDYQDGDR
jgi:hypothetical protein